MKWSSDYRKAKIKSTVRQVAIALIMGLLLWLVVTPLGALGLGALAVGGVGGWLSAKWLHKKSVLQKFFHSLVMHVAAWLLLALTVGLVQQHRTSERQRANIMKRQQLGILEVAEADTELWEVTRETTLRRAVLTWFGLVRDLPGAKVGGFALRYPSLGPTGTAWASLLEFTFGYLMMFVVWRRSTLPSQTL